MPTAIVVINKLDNFKCSGICSHSLLSVFSLSRDTFHQRIMWVIYKMPYTKKEPQSHKDETVYTRSLMLTSCVIQCHIILGLAQALRLLVSVLCLQNLAPFTPSIIDTRIIDGKGVEDGGQWPFKESKGCSVIHTVLHTELTRKPI